MRNQAIVFAAVFLLCWSSQAAEDVRPLTVCLVSGSAEYDSDRSLAAFQKYLEGGYNTRCTLLKARGFEDLPGLEALDDCDVALFFTRRLTIDGEQLERVKKYCESGRPLVALRTASHGFQKWLEFDKLVLGGNYSGHFGQGPTTQVKIEPSAKNHPVLDGISEFRSRASLYRTEPLAEDCTLLMTGETPESKGPQPLAWTRTYKGGRVFYTSLGSQTDFQNATFRRMIANALFWAANRELERKAPAPLPPRVAKPERKVTLRLRGRSETSRGTGDWNETRLERDITLNRTTIIICDMWDQHWCASATRRVSEMVPRMNEVIGAARRNGVLIIHAPSETLSAYSGTLARRRAIEAPNAAPPFPLNNWQSLDRATEGALPIDDSDGGCDCQPQCKQYGAWASQHPGIEISDEDAVSDSGQEIYNLLEQYGIQNVIIMGVHTNMCVLGRPFGIRQLVRLNKNPVLVRDLTDTMYNPRKEPFVTHAEGTQLVVQHVEKYWCPTILSDDLLNALR
jgi:type 1 glutamine amidotransferase/nicotinamidase-related amidase